MLCDVVQDDIMFSNSLDPRRHFETKINANKNKKDPFCLVLSLSQTPYILHLSKWQLFCVVTGPKLKQTAYFRN